MTVGRLKDILANFDNEAIIDVVLNQKEYYITSVNTNMSFGSEDVQFSSDATITIKE